MRHPRPRIPLSWWRLYSFPHIRTFEPASFILRAVSGFFPARHVPEDVLRETLRTLKSWHPPAILCPSPFEFCSP